MSKLWGSKRTSISGDDMEMSEGGSRMRRMPFLSAGRSLGSRFYNYGRHFRSMLIFIAVSALVVWIIDTWGDASLDWAHADMDDALTPDRDEGQRLHVLIPATHNDVNLCKLTTSLAALNYPVPVLLAYNSQNSDADHDDSQMRSKITNALTYVNSISSENELVVMLDGYDSWLQLPESALRARYYKLMVTANYRMRNRLGRRAVRREELKQTVVFGASKICTPNDKSSVACYSIPDALTPDDMYGSNTDSAIGETEHSSYRPRYLDAGFMMGPAKDVKRILERAYDLMQSLPTQSSGDDPNEKQLWSGDAQGIFNRIFGEQAYQREVIRRRYRSWFKKYSAPHTEGSFEGERYPDILEPPFPHETMSKLSGHPREFGINVDFYGGLVSNTLESESEHRSLVFDGVSRSSWDGRFKDRSPLACPNHLSSSLPADVVNATWPPGVKAELPKTKFTGNLCLGSIPVVIHHNGDNSFREKNWPEMWYQSGAKARLDKIEGKGAGAYSDKGAWVSFDEMCPQEYHEKLFGKQG